MIASVIAFLQIVVRLLADLVGLIALSLRPRRSIEAENLFLRRELALFKERGIRPRRVDAATRLSLALLSRLFDWRDALVVVRPKTMIRWHRAGWRLFWRFKSRPGRPRIPVELCQLIRRMATENPLWGEERIANELLLKLGLRVSPRTVRKYMPKRPPGRPRGDQRWATFLRNHAKAIVACDFFVAVTATFRLLYVFVVIHHSSRRLLHFNVTAHPTAAWTLQQLREAFGFAGDYRYLLRDRDTIFAGSLDESIKHLGLTVLKSPAHSPKANAICERVIGTIRRECLDWLIPLSDPHLRSMLKEWVTHYNGARPHMALGPGVPDPPAGAVLRANEKSRHRLGARAVVCARSLLGGLHHEYSLTPALA
jgi:transposase InsO family protein